MILPELGGRIQRALDKTNGYDFVYYNRVIKPALVGLAGPWISGGIEFNWPQHHRPSTFMPVDCTFCENPDGSATVTIGETDRINGTKGNASMTLYPDKAYIEIRGRLFNPTDYPQTFLWWANPAVSVNDNTFSVFPPDVNAVMDHGKRAVSTFPIATEAAETREKVRRIVKENPYVLQMHGFYMDKEEKTLRFDIVVSFDAKDRREVHRDVTERVQKAYPDYTLQIAMDIDFSDIGKA